MNNANIQNLQRLNVICKNSWPNMTSNIKLTLIQIYIKMASFAHKRNK